MKLCLTTAFVLLALVPCGWAQNYVDYTQPFDADASTAFLFDFNVHTHDNGEGFVPNAAASGWGMWRWAVINDAASIAYDATTNPGAGFGESVYVSGNGSWARMDTLVDNQDVIDGMGYGPGLTVEAWIKPASVTGYQRIVAHNSTYFLDVTGDEIDFWMALEGADPIALATDGVDIQIGQWYHVAGVFSGTTIEIWIDGVQRAAADLGGTFTAHAPTTGDWLVIGAAPWTGEDYNGSIDEVRISTVARYPIPVDTTPPVISLNGPDTITVQLDEAFVDPVTALDDQDGDLTSALVITGDTPVDTSLEGTYLLIYNVSDAAGNPATEVQLTVVVSADSDNDGLPDSWELQYFGTLSYDGDDDPDDDGMTNAEEFNFGTDPIDAISHLPVAGGLALALLASLCAVAAVSRIKRK